MHNDLMTFPHTENYYGKRFFLGTMNYPAAELNLSSSFLPLCREWRGNYQETSKAELLEILLIMNRQVKVKNKE